MGGMAELMATDGAMATQQAASDAADLAKSGFASMYAVKASKSRGRMLPAAQLAAGRKQVDGKLAAKSMRSGAASAVHGYAAAHSALNESESDSEPEHRLRGQVGEHTQSTQESGNEQRPQIAQLPYSEARFWQRTMPAEQSDLVGWPVMALFSEYDDQPAEDQKWHRGVVVSYDEAADLPYILFYETDFSWEAVDLPDSSIVFRKGIRESTVVHITPHMLPGNGEDLR